jgi:two-component system, NarL family, sensor histidine kinase BarA
MSYRSFKRVLGETNLERKCRLLFLACLSLLIAGSFFWYGRLTEQLVYRSNPDTARLLVPQVLLAKHWEALEPVKSAEFIASIADQIRNREFEWRLIVPSYNRQKEHHRPQDEFEQELLKRFIQIGHHRTDTSEKIPFEHRQLDDPKAYQYYQPIFTSTSCKICHGEHGISIGRPDLTEGDLMGVVVIQFSDEETRTALSRNRAILATTAIVTAFLAMLLLYVIVRYVIVKPLKHLRDVADDVSRGNIELRAELHTSDEFEEVAGAFNRMLRHLIAAQEELRHVNTDLDAKVDQLAQMNMRLHEMNRLKSDFLATMSHELRTPLNSIIGFSDVLEAIEHLDEKQRRYVKNIQKSGRMLLEMINDILDLAKIESGRMELRLSEFRMEAVIAAQCDMARPLAEKKNIDLEVRSDPALPMLHQDQGKVQQILNNLLSNAIKFTPEGGRIVVSAAPAGERDVTLVVSDTGVGIAPEDQTVIFEKFRQGTTALAGGDAITREYSGTGLGLSIVKELCKLLGGEIRLESELGKGSTFTVRLPRRLPSRPRLDSALVEGLDELTRPRVDYHRARDDQPVPAAAKR